MTFHRILPCVTSAAFGLCASLAAQADHALIISGHGGEGDADRFVNALVTSGEFDGGDITILTGPDLSRDTVINALMTDLPRQTDAGDKVLIYYSGLGGQRAGAGAADEPDGLDEVFILDPVSGASLMDNEIETTIDQLEGRYVSVFLDTAFASAADVPTIVGYRGSGQINGAVEGLLGAALGVDLPKIPDVPEDGADVVDAALPLAQDLAEENGPLKTQNPKAQIFSASTPQTRAWEDETGGAFTTTLIDSIENNAADQNSNGDLSSAEFITYARESLADLCKSIVHCEATNMAFSPAVVVANDRLASLGGGISADGQIVSDGLIADGEPFAATIPNMSHDQRVGFVSDRFG
ncbi:MAG: caspase family protein, partial [Pseudomonadota bacterium]